MTRQNGFYRVSEIDEVFGFLFRNNFFKIGRILSFKIFLLVPGVPFWGDFAFCWLRLGVVVGIAWYDFSILWYCTLGKLG